MELNSIVRFRDDQNGATMIEYALLLACIAVVMVASVSMVGEESRKVFVHVSGEMAGANIPANPPPIP